MPAPVLDSPSSPSTDSHSDHRPEGPLSAAASGPPAPESGSPADLTCRDVFAETLRRLARLGRRWE